MFTFSKYFPSNFHCKQIICFDPENENKALPVLYNCTHLGLRHKRILQYQLTESSNIIKHFVKEFLLNFGNTELWQPSKHKSIHAANADALKRPHPKTQTQANLN